MALDDLISRANREFASYVRVANDIGTARDIATRQSSKIQVVAALHPFTHHNHALVLAEKMEDVLVGVVDAIEPHIEDARNRVQMRSTQHGAAGLQSDSTRNVFTRTVYAFTHRRPADWDRAEAVYRARNLNLILRDDEFEKAYTSAHTADVFLCHCSEDKAAIVRPLAETLIRDGLLVWVDEVSLKLGDSLIEKIDVALKTVPFGAVIILPTFLTKRGWTDREFRSLATKELIQGKKAILPIWHNVTHKDVAGYSLELADRFAAKTSDGIPAVAKAIYRAVKGDRPRY
jgi:hypothetical protein